MAEFDNNNQNSNFNSNNYGINNNAANDAQNNASYTYNTNNNYNNGNNHEAYDNQNPQGNATDYSFYAEQLPADNKVPNYDPNYQSQGYTESNQQQAYGSWRQPGGFQSQGYQQQGHAGNYQQPYPYSYNYNNPNYNNTSGGYGYQSNQYGGMNNPYGNYYNQYNNAGNKPPKKEKKPGKLTKVLRFAGKALCFGLIAAVGFMGFHQFYSYINPERSVQRAIDALETENNSYEISYTKPASITVSDKSIISDVTEQNLPAIVSINSITRQSNWFGQTFDVPGSGSGIIVGKTEKEILIATNNHVVQGASEITITFVDGKEANAVTKGTDVAADLAVVSVDIADIPAETLDKITVAKLGNSDEVKVGELAIAIGNALGYGQSVTVGYISAKDREVEVSEGYLSKSKKMILLQTDAAINPGNSGGALLNARGEVIGINSVKYANEEVEGMGFAIPISTAIPIINELMSREILREEEQGFLGITGDDVTEDISEAYNMPIGVYISSVVEGGPAQKAGLRQGDIIIKVDEIKITSISQLREYVNSRRVGTDVSVSYMRYNDGQYEEKTVTVTLGKNPNLKD